MAKKKRPEKQELTQETEAAKNSKGAVDLVWDFLSSMKLGIILLLVLAVAAIIGTIWVPENEYGQPDYLKFYNNPLFNILLGLLALNLLVCSLNRLKVIISTLKGPNPDFAEGFIKNLKSVQTLKVKNNPSALAENIKETLSSRGYRIFTGGDSDQLKVAADKGRWGILGPYLTHLGFFVMILALMVKFSGLVGFDGSMAGAVGDTVNLGQVRGIANVNPKDYFDIKINDFRTEYRSDGSIKQWYSDVTVIDGDKTLDYTIYVNRPLVYKGIKFYQTGYGTQLAGQTAGPDGKSQNFTIGLQDYIFVPGTDTVIIPLDYNAEKEEVFIRVFKGHDFVDQKWVGVGQKYQYEQGEVSFAAVTPYTVLSVKKDPGVPIIGVGTGLFMLGIVLSFVQRQKRVWALVKGDAGGATVFIGGISNKDKIGLDNDLDSITAGLNK